ncbi:PEP-CTERM sorting domain-containing protein [Aestuariispira ectoiniformans]|nr:PEP-CTERM sorting domain-containing protein [Aestuariispira ectoiniformans]
MALSGSARADIVNAVTEAPAPAGLLLLGLGLLVVGLALRRAKRRS